MPRNKLIREHMPLARSIARGYRGRGLSPEDLEGEAFEALVEAASDHDDGQHDPASFKVYATLRIRRHIQRAIERSRVVAIPRALARAIPRVLGAEASLMAAGERRPTATSIAEATGLDAALCRQALEMTPLEVGVESIGESDRLEPEYDRLLAGLEQVLELCDALGRQVLELVAIRDLSLRQAARRLGRPLSEVSRAHDEACLAVAAGMRRKGWTARSIGAAIA